MGEARRKKLLRKAQEAAAAATSAAVAMPQLGQASQPVDEMQAHIARRREIIEASDRERANRVRPVEAPLGQPAGSVYRFFSEEEHAAQFALGSIRLSTLETCRGYESAKGDKAEAVHEYKITRAAGDPSKNPILAKQLDQIGFVSDGPVNIIIEGLTHINIIADALLLCLTTENMSDFHSERFGKFGVEVTNPGALFDLLTSAVVERHGEAAGQAGMVEYKDRKYKDLEVSPGRVGFVKPADDYADEKEYRMLWVLKHAQPKRETFDIPEARKFLRLMQPSELSDKLV